MNGCDCLVYCGDDPRLKNGRAAPCERRAEQDRQRGQLAARAERVAYLRRELGCLDEVEALERLAVALVEVARLRRPEG